MICSHPSNNDSYCISTCYRLEYKKYRICSSLYWGSLKSLRTNGTWEKIQELLENDLY